MVNLQKIFTVLEKKSKFFHHFLNLYLLINIGFTMMFIMVESNFALIKWLFSLFLSTFKLKKVNSNKHLLSTPHQAAVLF